MLEWMRALRFRWVIGLALGWWALVVVVILAFTLFAPANATALTAGHVSFLDADGALNIIDTCGGLFTSTERFAVAFTVPVAFSGLWLLARCRRG
jgi:hypothetical protein